MASDNSILDIMRKYSAGDADQGNRLIEHGQIQQMLLPTGWKERRFTHTVVGTSSLRIFSPKDKPEIKLCFYYRGRHVNKQAARNFHGCLSSGDHVLSVGEIKSICDVLEGKSRPQDFDLQSARIVSLNGRTVLSVQGKWKEIDEQVEGMYVAANEQANAIQEIFYQSPSAAYDGYWAAIHSAISSIEWKALPEPLHSSA